jgi:uncharacterized membrane protein
MVRRRASASLSLANRARSQHGLVANARSSGVVSSAGEKLFLFAQQVFSHTIDFPIVPRTQPMAVSPMHLLNLAAHLGAGLAAIGLGVLMLASAKGTHSHRSRGRVFVALTCVVCATGAIGNVFFRFMPLFAVLTVLVAYQLASGWHVVFTKGSGPNRVDALLAVCAGGWALYLIPQLITSGTQDAAAIVIHSSLGGLFVLLAYDLARWCFPRRWHASLWRYEHIYKLISALFAMLSAATGNLVKVGQPWSQLLPSVLGALAILWFFQRTWRAGRRAPPYPASQAVAGD